MAERDWENGFREGVKVTLVVIGFVLLLLLIGGLIGVAVAS